MVNYKVTHPKTGKVVRITGERPPSEQELINIFSAVDNNNSDVDVHSFVNEYKDKIEEMPSIDERIEERGSAFFKDRFDNWKNSSGIINPLLKASSVINIPQERTEAAISNALLAVQEGRFDDIVDEFRKGARGEKLGEIGDIFRNSKDEILSSEPVAATAGFIISMISPLDLFDRANKALTGLYKATDRKVLRAGEDLIKGADEAVRVIGRNLDKAYAVVNDINVDGMKLINSFDSAPDILVKYIEKEFGKNIEDIAQNVTIKDIRKIKRLIGEIKPSSFGKETRGAIENIETKNINKIYSNVKNIIQDSLNFKGMSKEAESLLDADEAFTNTINASKFIKRSVVDPILFKPTHGGKVALGLVKEGDVTTRLALTTLKKAGGQARKNIDKAISSLDKYNKYLARINTAKTIGKAALYGGAVGAVGGRIAGKVMGR